MSVSVAEKKDFPRGFCSLLLNQNAFFSSFFFLFFKPPTLFFVFLFSKRKKKCKLCFWSYKFRLPNAMQIDTNIFISFLLNSIGWRGWGKSRIETQKRKKKVLTTTLEKQIFSFWVKSQRGSRCFRVSPPICYHFFVSIYFKK